MTRVLEKLLNNKQQNSKQNNWEKYQKNLKFQNKNCKPSQWMQEKECEYFECTMEKIEKILQ